MTVADKEGNMVSNSKQLQGWVLEWFLLNWALCYKRELFDLEEESPTPLRQKNVLSYNYTCLCD
jgi:hypothetical protein